MSKTIIVAFDNRHSADVAVAHAAMLAGPLGAKVCLCGNLATNMQAFVDPLVWSIAASEFEATIKTYADMLHQQGIQTEVNLVKKPIIEELCCPTDDNDLNLIITPSEDAIHSPFIQALLKHTSIPVLLARSGGDDTPRFQNIAVPLDGSQRAESGLFLALAIAGAVGARVHLVNIVPKVERVYSSNASTQELALEEQLTQRKVEEAKRYLDQLAARLMVDVYTHVLVDNKVTTAIHNMLWDHEVDLLILSAHGQSGEAQWPLGTVAENLIRYGDISTIVVQDLPSEITRLESYNNVMRIPSGAY